MFFVFVPFAGTAAKVVVISQGMPLPSQGLPTFNGVLAELEASKNRVELDEFAEEMMSLFHADEENISTKPLVADSIYQVVLAWKHEGAMLLVASDGAASFRQAGVLGWTNGWFDLAMMESIPGLKALSPINSTVYPTAVWRLRFTNETKEVVTLNDFRGRPLAVIKPQETIERFLINRVDAAVQGNVVIHEVCLKADYSVGLPSGVRLPLDPPGALRARGVGYPREVRGGGVTLKFGPDSSTGVFIATLTPEQTSSIWMLVVIVVTFGVVLLILRWLLASGRTRSVEE
ncbi:MAG: hypothetical protein D6724_05630 [Armatimonadetes bacterium]|nr:MAG: hypothetical protein D6724_05630 [Armatimonadota bacterium]